MLKISTIDKSAFIVAVLFCGLLVSGALMIKQFYYSHNYAVYLAAPCDPTVEICFVGDGETQPRFYAQVVRPAYTLNECVWDGSCSVNRCDGAESHCEEIVCDTASAECSIPESLNL